MTGVFWIDAALLAAVPGVSETHPALAIIALPIGLNRVPVGKIVCLGSGFS